MTMLNRRFIRRQLTNSWQQSAIFILSVALATAGRDGIASMLYGVSALDPLTYVAVFALVTVVSLFAVYVPAQRATRVDPMTALRVE